MAQARSLAPPRTKPTAAASQLENNSANFGQITNQFQQIKERVHASPPSSRDRRLEGAQIQPSRGD
jgi:hypothetical protein